jgi:E3 ubiquitin-protein ligase DOA10
MQRNIQGNVQDNRGRNVAFRNRSGLETMLERVSDRVIQEVIRYLEDFAERELADAISDRLEEMSDQLVEHCMERLEERLNGIEERMLERMTNDIEQRLIGRMTARFPRNETRQVRNGPGERRNDVVINEEAENGQNLDDEVDSSGEEEPLYMRFYRDGDVDEDEVNDGLNEAENP